MTDDLYEAMIAFLTALERVVIRVTAVVLVCVCVVVLRAIDCTAKWWVAAKRRMTGQ